LNSLRITWLSDQTGLDRKIHNALWAWWATRDIISRMSKEAHEILGGNIRDNELLFSSSIALVSSNYEPQIPWVNIVDILFFYKRFGRYLFQHTFFKRDNAQGMENKMQSIWCIRIDHKVIAASIEELKIETFKQLEKSFWAVFALMNHDATMHRFWVAIPADTTWANKLLKNQLWFERGIARNTSWAEIHSPQEIASATFHRDIFDEIDELWVPLKEFLLYQTCLILEIISEIQDSEIKNYWNQVLKYPLMSLINPESEEIQRLKIQYPLMDFNSTHWAELIHKKELEINAIWENGMREFRVPVRDLRKVMMPYYHNQTPWVEKGIWKLLKDKSKQ